MEQIELLADFAVVALFGFFEHDKIFFKFIRLFESRRVNARKHGTLYISAPISACGFNQFKRLRVYFFCVCDVGAAAQVGKIAVCVYRYLFVFG